MKKLSLLIALMLCVTIGGVYATWSYAGTNDIADQYAEVKATLTPISYMGESGTYVIETNLVLTIDDPDESDHVAELVYGSNNDAAPYIKVTFTAADHASPAIKAGAVESEIYFKTSTTMEYKNSQGTTVDIFKFSNPGDGELNNVFDWTPAGTNVFTYTMDLAAIQDAIQLNDTFILGTPTEYEAFASALAGNIFIRVTDGTVNQ